GSARVAEALDNHPDASIATLCQTIMSPDEMNNSHIVKVIRDSSGYALYFSRSAIPWLAKEATQHSATGSVIGYKHMGIYAYRADFLDIYIGLKVPEIVARESLEQLRALEAGMEIAVGRVDQAAGGVDTAADLEAVRHRLDKAIVKD
ncbi:MAG: 3-deoxy-manno-octulosonate cytidylyltransferase, partial [Candidatus Puniceispirillum sp.]